MEQKRSYEFGVDYIYKHQNNPRFRPKENSVFISIRSREFLITGFYDGIAPTIHARDYKDPKCVIVPVETELKDYRECYSSVIGGIGEKKSNNNTQWYQQDRIYDSRDCIAVCCSAQVGGGSNLYLVEEEAKVERRIVAMRGRNPSNPNERARSDGNYFQRFEFNSQGICNTLTTVDKDNYVLEVVNG